MALRQFAHGRGRKSRSSELRLYAAGKRLVLGTEFNPKIAQPNESSRDFDFPLSVQLVSQEVKKSTAVLEFMSKLVPGYSLFVG